MPEDKGPAKIKNESIGIYLVWSGGKKIIFTTDNLHPVKDYR
jgi:hypothetical protein